MTLKFKILLGVAAVVVIIAAVDIYINPPDVSVREMNTQPSSTLPPPENPSPKFTRNEFKEKVLNKTPDEVIQIIGHPYETNEHGRTVTWTYKNLTYDTITGKTDSRTTVLFFAGFVDTVLF